MKILFFAILLTLTVSCTKEILIDLNDSNPQYVIEGNITNQQGPYYVKISQSINFREPNNYPKISNASVVISDDNNNVDTLKETENGVYATSKIQGVPGRTYYLNIQINGKKFTSICKMPEPVLLDSIDFIQNPISILRKTEKTYILKPIFIDPVNIQNNYRFIQWANGVKDSTFLVTNDNVFDGHMNEEPLRSERFDIHNGDTVTLQMQNIDKSVYTYFYSLNQSAGDGPGGNATPSNPVSNITGGVMGYFSAHTVQEMKKIIRSN